MHITCINAAEPQQVVSAIMFFEELMARPDFGRAMDGIIPEFRKRFGLPDIRQLGLVVADVEQAALRLEERGVPPFFIASGSPV